MATKVSAGVNQMKVWRQVADRIAKRGVDRAAGRVAHHDLLEIAAVADQLAGQLEDSHGCKPTALQAARVLRGVRWALANPSNKVARGLGLAATALNKAVGQSDRGYAVGQYGRSAEELRTLVDALLERGTTAQEIAAELADVSIHRRQMKRVFPGLTGSRAERAERLLPVIEKHAWVHRKTPDERRDIAESIVTKCARSCGFARPSSLFDRHSKRAKRAP